MERGCESQDSDDHQYLRVAQTAGAAQEKACGKRRLQKDKRQNLPKPRYAAKGQEQRRGEKRNQGDGEMDEEEALMTRALEIVVRSGRMHQRADPGSETR
jgi:hypothetical protein